MCDLTNMEFPGIYTETKRKANKEHVCCECASLILKGEYYVEKSGLWDGKFDRFKQCSTCDRLHVLAKKKGIIFCLGELWEAAGLLEGELND